MIWNRNGITWYSEDEIERYRTTLQEIKRIIIQEKVTNNKKLRAILDLITKLEDNQ